MCLILEKDKLTPKYTTKDKVVYKWLAVCNGSIISPFRNFVYNLGEVYTSLLIRSCSWYKLEDYIHFLPKTKIHRKTIIVPRYGFAPHSHNEFIKHFASVVSIPKDEIDLGFHSLDSIESAFKYERNTPNLTSVYTNVFLYECIIPKHSWYYEGTYGEIASDHLIVVKQLDN